METKNYTHQCSCGQSYTDNDPDLYFCSACIEVRKSIAKEIDKKMAGRVSNRQTKSDLQIYNESPRVHGFPLASNFI